MIVRAYGDSWTEGQGTDVVVEKSITERHELRKFRNDNSWVKFVCDKLDMTYINNGLSGASNLKIFNQLTTDIKEGLIAKDDFVFVMWSSSLRDNVPFLPNNEWLSWSIKQLFETSSENFIKSYKSGNVEYDNFLQSYKELFIAELFNQNYYNIINQNYIIFTQKLMESYGIKYFMCDAFETMIIDLNKSDDVTKHINKKTYWNFGKKCFKDFLLETKKDDIWEPIVVSKQDVGGIHPNKSGYELIANEIYNYLKLIDHV
jgi:lysophospholipase L1-like esterase